MSTIQTNAVRQALSNLGHATNQQLHEEVTKHLPGLSATTIHRITTRLVENNEISYAPSNGKVVVLDARPEPHEHFVCKGCGGLKDIQLPTSILEAIQDQLGKNIVSDGLVVCGMCEVCASNGIKK